jgi:thiol-disulfide isomerase/thioredoxin
MRYHRFIHSDALRGGKTAPRYKLIVLSAVSFCGFCQQMAKTKDELEKELKDINVTLNYIEDENNEEEFNKMKDYLKKKGAKIEAFPHLTLLVDDKFLAEFSGLKQPEEMKKDVEDEIRKKI